MKNTFFETLIGAIVIAIAGYFLIVAATSSGKPDAEYYELTAQFDRVDGLSVGADVRVSGLPVGYVSQQTLDPETFLAIVTLSVDKTVGIPSDSTAEIIGDGLLGAKYVAVVPGGSDQLLKDGEEISFTQSAVSLESLIGKFMFGGENGGGGSTSSQGNDKDEDTSIDHIF